MISSVDLIAKFKYALDDRWGYIYGVCGGTWTEAKQKQTISGFGPSAELSPMRDWKRISGGDMTPGYRARRKSKSERKEGEPHER